MLHFSRPLGMVAVLCAAVASTAAGATACRLSNVHGDHMVLQRDKVTTLYGFAAPGTAVTTTFRGSALKATTSAAGEWRQPLPPTPASTATAGETLEFGCSSGEQFELRDVLFGDVVMCGGQSNMQFTLVQITDTPPCKFEVPVACTPAPSNISKSFTPRHSISCRRVR